MTNRSGTFQHVSFYSTTACVNDQIKDMEKTSFIWKHKYRIHSDAGSKGILCERV